MGTVVICCQKWRKTVDEANIYMNEQLDKLLEDIKGVNKTSYGNVTSYGEKL